MSERLRIIFMGTPDFAVKSLEALNQKFNIIAVITAPDKKRGRGQQIVPTPVKKYATEANIPVLQPTNLKDESFINELNALKPDLNVVVAFRMLPEVVWSLPMHGSVNLHASLLPEYRGAAPINHAIMNGEKETGVTTFFLEKTIDTGKIIDQKTVQISTDDNAGSLHDKLMNVGADLLVETVQKIENGTVQSIAQPDRTEKHAPKIFKENCKIDWSKPGNEIHNFIRGLSPYPAAWTTFSKNGKPFTVKIFSGKHIAKKSPAKRGTVSIEGDKLFLMLEDGIYEILELQPQSKKRMSAQDFIRGLQKNDKLELASE